MAEPETAGVVARVPAKINVALAVGPVRADGFHDLATVFHSVSLWDDVTAIPSASFEIELDGPYAVEAPPDASNLALRAARLLADRAKVTDGVRLHVRKEIPVAGGLAGGSADAAGALLACARLWDLDMPEQSLYELAAELGSDVPFALRGGTALGEGRGERLASIPMSRRLHWVIVTASGGLSTPDVYRRFDALGSVRGDAMLPDSVLSAVRTGRAHAVAKVMFNDLQAAAVDLRPDLRRTLQHGVAAGALAGVVSGSGPTCVFLADDDEHADVLAGRLGEAGFGDRVLTVFGPVEPETWAAC